MHTHRAIDYVELGATDLEALKTFYASAFGWTFTDYGPEYAAFSGKSGLEGGFTTQAKPGGNPLVILFSEHLEDTRDTVVQHGGTIAKEIFSFPGGRRFHFKDPSGNELAAWSER